MTVGVPANRAVDRVAGAHLGQPLGAPVRHQDRRLPPEAVDTGMATSTIGINSPAEREAGGVGYPVDDRPGLYLEERHAAEARRVESAGHRALLEQHRRRLRGW